jgi:type II secretory pathway pseudopilin PulG
MLVASRPVSRFTPSAGIALGPILFLLAVIAIIAAVASASVGGFSANTTTEGGKITASAIIRVGEDLQNAVRRVNSHGCLDTQINFNNPVISGYTNPNAPTDGTCDVFGPNGGAMTFPTITASTDETAYDKGYFICQGNEGLTGLGLPQSSPNGAGQELLCALPIDSQTLCQQINQELGLSSYSGLGSYTMSTDGNGHFIGTYQNTLLLVHGGTWPSPSQPLMGCLTEGDPALGQHSRVWDAPVNASYFYYVVLLIR